LPKEVRYLLFSTEEMLAALLTEGAETTPGEGLGALSFSVPMMTGLDGGVVLRIARRLTCLALSITLNATPGDPDLAALERRVEDIYSRV